MDIGSPREFASFFQEDNALLLFRKAMSGVLKTSDDDLLDDSVE